MVSAEGIESAKQRKFNNIQGHGWHRRLQKAVQNQRADCTTDRRCSV